MTSEESSALSISRVLPKQVPHKHRLTKGSTRLSEKVLVSIRSVGRMITGEKKPHTVSSHDLNEDKDVTLYIHREKL